MKFNDYITLKDKDYDIMRENYDRVLANETKDLQDILEKMQEQMRELLTKNTDSRYDEVIVKLQKNISELEKIISNNESNILYHHKYPEHPQVKGFARNIHKLEEEVAHSPIRSREEIERHRNSNQSPTNIDIPNEDPLRSPSPAMPSTQPNTLKRNSPMQSHFFANIIKKFAIGRRQEKSHNISLPQNKFHNIISQHHKCREDKLVTNQIDIIRLLLLYIALRPNCKYLSRISTIANEQFESYLIIDSIEAYKN